MPDIYVAAKPKIETKPKPEVEKKDPLFEVKQELQKTGGKKGGLLSAFVAQPKNLKFETQEKKEKVILLLRRHPITNLNWIATALFFFCLPLIFSRFNPLDFIPTRYQLVTNLLWYLLIFAFIFEKFLTWFFNVNIITDERVIDIDFPSILYKDISETKIDQIQDVSIKVGGFTRSLFNFGNVFIQTAGAEPEIHFEDIPNPEQVSRILNQLMIEEEKEKIEGRVR